jgi:DNA-binding response OmpR family regulator
MNIDANKILVVDDEYSLVQLCQIILEAAGYVVRTAITGSEALELITEEMPDIVLLDVMMPGMSGIDVCRHIRKQYDSHKPYIFMYTADDSRETYDISKMAGANALITKDTPVFELPTKIGSYLPCYS